MNNKKNSLPDNPLSYLEMMKTDDNNHSMSSKQHEEKKYDGSPVNYSDSEKYKTVPRVFGLDRLPPPNISPPVHINT